MKDNHLTAIGIICITVLECVALANGMDGVIFGTVISIIAGLCGYKIGKRRR